MSQLTLELKNDNDLELLIAFAKRLNIMVLDIKRVQTKSKQSPVFWLEKLASEGGTKSIENPSIWQNEVREDKSLYNRD